jgi:hypothetical protein
MQLTNECPRFYLQYNEENIHVYERERHIDQVKDNKMGGGCRTRGRKDKFINTGITHVKPS